ncbi:hypothetical protein ACNKHX_19180 [Shigella flexneri]
MKYCREIIFSEGQYNSAISCTPSAWLGFKGTDWKNEINVRDFIQHNYTPYEGDESSLANDACHHGIVEKVMEGVHIEIQPRAG